MPCLGNTNPSQEISSLTGSLEITGTGEIVDFKGSDGTVPVYMCHKLVGTEVQGISIVGYTGVEGGRTRLWNLQYLCPVPP